MKTIKYTYNSYLEKEYFFTINVNDRSQISKTRY